MPTDTPDQQRPPRRHRLHRLIAMFAIASVAAVVLAACGSSSKSSSSSATNSASTTHSGTSPSNRFASLRACMQKEGINLGSASPGGQPGSGGPPGAGGGFKLPEGVSQSKFQEALKKCGGGGFPGGARRGFNSSTARAALTKYASCMREHGVKLPTPNTSGKGPVFNTKGINTSSAAFKSAQQKCQSDLKGAFGAGGRPPGGGEGGPPGGAEGGPPPGAPGPEGTSGG